MSNKVINMGAATGDATKVDPAELLRLIADEMRRGGPMSKCSKMVVIGLDDSDGFYDISFRQAGMAMSECVALAEAAKRIFLDEIFGDD